jgi:hypothetical protein
MERNDLVVYDASVNDVNGGSLRVFVTHKENDIEKTKSYKDIFELESSMCLNRTEIYERFFESVCNMRRKVKDYIQDEHEKGNLVIGLGASTKGNVLLQFFGINKELLLYISERDIDKVSLRTLGTDIELISEDKARELHPSCMLVLIWFFKDEILKREKSYLQNGGKLLFPMPDCYLVTQDGECKI